MYFSRIELPATGLEVSQLERIMGGEGYGHHQQLWKLFSRSREQARNFIYSREDECSWPRFYTVSGVMPVDDNGLWRIDAKPYQPQIREGMRLAFRLRVNPVVRKREAAHGGDKTIRGKQSRHDVVMEAKRRARQSGDDSVMTHNEAVQRAGVDWLARRAEARGFTLREDQVVVNSYRQHRLRKRSQAVPIRFSTLDYEGLLTVADADRFLETLYHGIGPSKGFGCGLLMVRRA